MLIEINNKRQRKHGKDGKEARVGNDGQEDKLKKRWGREEKTKERKK